MKIALIDSFYDESHQFWAKGLQKHSNHEIEIFSNEPFHWKWQMVGGTMNIAQKIGKRIEDFDALLVTDMVDLPCLIGYLKEYKIPPTIVYFHENQITYPWSPNDEDLKHRRDHHYGFMNYRSAYIADNVVFNSEYHLSSFLNALPEFLSQFPTSGFKMNSQCIDKKSVVLPIGIEMEHYRTCNFSEEKPIFLWNHRWEYDKGPNLFFSTLMELNKKGIEFDLIVLGKSHRKTPKVFEEVAYRLKERIIHWGYVKESSDYYRLLQIANIALITSQQDFFGISVVEAISAGCYPLLPKRLAYREHIERAKWDEIFYTDEDLMKKLIHVIMEKKYKDTASFQGFVSKYDWSLVIGEYDSLFENALR